MITLKAKQKIYVYKEAVDMRKAIDGLSVLLVDQYSERPQSGDIYLFRNKPGNKVKLLYWDRNGFILHYKRLEKNRFKFPKDMNVERLKISKDQLGWLLAGLDFSLMERFKELDFSKYY